MELVVGTYDEVLLGFRIVAVGEVRNDKTLILFLIAIFSLNVYKVAHADLSSIFAHIFECIFTSAVISDYLYVIYCLIPMESTQTKES